METRWWSVGPEAITVPYHGLRGGDCGFLRNQKAYFRILTFSHLPFFIHSACYKYVTSNLLFHFLTHSNSLPHNHHGGDPARTIEGI